MAATEDRTRLLTELKTCNLALDESEDGKLSPEVSRRFAVRSSCGKVLAVIRVQRGAEKETIRALQEGLFSALLGE